MSTNLPSGNSIPLLRFWTRRYAGVLIAILIFLGIIAGVWIKVNENQQSFQLLQTRAEQLSVSYIRSTEVLQSQPSSSQDELHIPPSTPAVPVTPATLATPAEIVRPVAQDFMQIFTEEGHNLINFSSLDISLSETLAETPTTIESVLGGNSTKEKVKIKESTWLRVGIPLSKEGEVIGALYLSTPSPEIFLDNIETYGFLVLIILGIAFGGWLVIYHLSRKLILPLHQLTEAARQVSEGDYSPNLPSTTKVKEAELQQLFSSFEVMTKRLQQLEQMRTDLLAGVSHELRTPITSIRGMLQAVQGGIVIGETADQFLVTTLEEAKRMQKMVEDLLDFASLESSAIHGEFVLLSLSEVVEEAIQQVHAIENFKNIDIDVSPSIKPLKIVADRGQLKQVLLNLLMNSAGAEANKITLNITIEDKKLNLDILDNGKGIATPEIPYIFERYYRGDSKRKKKQGLGLGLPLSRLLAEANNCELLLVSTTPHETIFRLIIPIE
ncbi:HAMP domain-containing sensor histidine kinase [Psychrobacillus sp. INOP01]|uniref:HAMP domain-containing sensor histidine kinase n=1 Tax=Psychrobacillus sp. INOP01 TaxID=2829187 RepID=UPI001F1B87B0|nr:HAMP domain-containing sensor histidine kinase [Psychrobacillus sp. INOP01]